METFKAIDYLINGKATGHDGILEEMLKISKYVPIPHLLILFNNILVVCKVVCKVLVEIRNNRLGEWA